MSNFDPSVRYYMIHGVPITSSVEAVTRFGIIDSVNKLKPVTDMPEFVDSGEKIVIDSMPDMIDSLSESLRYTNRYLDGIKISNGSDESDTPEIKTRVKLDNFKFDDDLSWYDDSVTRDLVQDIINRCEEIANDTMIKTLLDLGVTDGESLNELMSDGERTCEFISLYNEKIDLRGDREFLASFKIGNPIVFSNLSDVQKKRVTNFIQNWLRGHGYFV